MRWLFVFAGLLAGPSLHHLAVRASAYAPFTTGVPACETCGARRPLFGLAGTPCPACDSTPRRRRWWVGVAAGAGFWGAVQVAGWTWILPALVVFVAVTVILVVTDLDAKLIPNRILYPGGTVATLLLGAGALAEGEGRAFAVALGLGVAYFALFYLVALAARGGFGFGDVKLAALLGVFTGFYGWRTLFVAVFLTGLIGGLPAIFLLVSGKAGRKYELPYGPAMVAGAWAALLFADAIVRGV